MFEWLRHWLNAGHVYCRLRDAGMSIPRARRLAEAWERLIQPLLYRGRP